MSNANLYDAEILEWSERQVVRWTAEMLGLPLSASGLVVSGTSIANLVAVLVARAGARSGQPAGRHRRGATTDASAALRSIRCNGSDGMDISALPAAIRAGRATRGVQPSLVVGAAGSVDTGAINHLAAPALRPLFADMEHADAVAFDFPKWAPV